MIYNSPKLFPITMVKCLNCEEDVPKYMTQAVDVDTFPTLTEKAKKFGFDQIRVCEDCYDTLAANLTTKSGEGTYLHPYFQNSSSDVKE